MIRSQSRSSPDALLSIHLALVEIILIALVSSCLVPETLCYAEASTLVRFRCELFLSSPYEVLLEKAVRMLQGKEHFSALPISSVLTGVLPNHFQTRQISQMLILSDTFALYFKVESCSKDALQKVFVVSELKARKLNAKNFIRWLSHSKQACARKLFVTDKNHI